MSPSTFEIIKNKMSSVGSVTVKNHRDHLLSLENPHKPKDLNKRLRWDLFSFCFSSKWICNYLYSAGLNDTHIDTALRQIMDEVFGSENFCSLITVRKTLPLGSFGLGGVSDYIIWYAKKKESYKYRQLFVEKGNEEDSPSRLSRSNLLLHSYSIGKD